MTLNEMCTDEFWKMNEFCWDSILGEDYLYLTAKLSREKCWLCGGFNVHSEPCKEQNHEWNKMDFGRHRGLHVSKVSSGYLEFCLVKGVRSEEERGRWLIELQNRDAKYKHPKWEGLVSDKS
mgnify:FL=1